MMDILETLTRHSQVRADLMGRMMARLGIDPETVGREALGTRLLSMANRCRMCRHVDECALWLDGKTSGSYREFCPNAGTFDALRR